MKPRPILGCLKSRCCQHIGVNLFDPAFIERRIALVLNPPAETVDQPGKCVRAIPLAKLDPSPGPIGKEVLIGVNGQVLFVEVRLEMQHMPKADQARIVGPSGKRRIPDESRGEEVAPE